ncbi:MAG: ribbon-helix-helix protein, CopG family [Cyanobacteria bacterium J06554_6]
MPARFTITLPDKLAKALEEWADDEGRTRANLATFLVELGIRERFPDRFPPRIKRDSEPPPSGQ